MSDDPLQETILKAIRSVHVGCGHADYVNEMFADAVAKALRDPEMVDGRPVIRVTIDCTVPADTPDDEREFLAGLLADRMGDNLDAVLGVNERLAVADVQRWWVRGTGSVPAEASA
jgi:hypothetical protein